MLGLLLATATLSCPALAAEPSGKPARAAAFGWNTAFLHESTMRLARVGLPPLPGELVANRRELCGGLDGVYVGVVGLLRAEGITHEGRMIPLTRLDLIVESTVLGEPTAELSITVPAVWSGGSMTQRGSLPALAVGERVLLGVATYANGRAQLASDRTVVRLASEIVLPPQGALRRLWDWHCAAAGRGE